MGLSYEDIKMESNYIGDDLLQRLKLGKISKIGIDEIRAAIVERTRGWGLCLEDRERFEELTTRRVVWKASAL